MNASRVLHIHKMLSALLVLLGLLAACGTPSPTPRPRATRLVNTPPTRTTIPSATPVQAAEAPETTPTPQVTPAAPSIPTPPPLSYPIGLEGEIANIPAARARQYDWSQYPDYVNAVMDLYAATGSRVARINIAQTRAAAMPDIEQYGYDALDALIAGYQRHGVRVTLTVAYQHELAGGKGADITQPWLWTNDAERARYEAYLREIVERYDGDGIDDAPGLLYPITVWQVHNELEAQWAVAFEQGVTTWATPEDYATLLQFTAAVIREEMPNAVIVASNYPWPGHDAYDFNGDGKPERYMERVAELGGYQGIDAVEIHDFSGDLKSLVDGLTYAHQTSGLPVWAGQVLALNKPTQAQPDASLETQAQKVVKLLVGALAVGAEQAHWWGLQNMPDEVVGSGGMVPVFAYSGLYGPCPGSAGIGQICAAPPLYPAGVNFRALAEAFLGYRGLTVLEPLTLGVVPGKADSSRAVVRVERDGADPFVIAWDDAGGSLDVGTLFPEVETVRVRYFVTQEGVFDLPAEEGVRGGHRPLGHAGAHRAGCGQRSHGGDLWGSRRAFSHAGPGHAKRPGPKAAFIVFHLEVSRGPRIKALWPKLEQFMALADRYDVKVTLQFSWPWADYVYKSGLLDTVHAWEANGHEIALHHHGPTHTFFDGYTDAPDAIGSVRYATNYGYLGDMSALMEFLAPLTQKGITSAGMSDADTDWPAGVLYYATDSGDSPSKADLLSRPVETTHNGHPVVEIYNAGYQIDHLGTESTNLADVEHALQTAAPDEYLGLVVNDNTLEAHFDQIEPLFQLLGRYGVQVETVSALMATR
ncbi:MAG: hypothetical protein Q9O62_08565 [Ardenticatenia bacterium]|nr:hypothetical protein [Ardenticatenia bacterium]